MNKSFLEAFTTPEQLNSFLEWEKGLRDEIAQEIQSYQFANEAKARLFEDDRPDPELALQYHRYASCYKHAAMIVRGQL